ncbi:HYR domain-containing protein [Pseudohoeflea suaedae]|nr:HYR domain-containing protein [Pseudohoeflea suaedae]
MALVCPGHAQSAGDTTAPEALALVRLSPSTTITNADALIWRLTFDEDVKNVDASDFSFSGTTAALGVVGSGAVYDLTLSGGDLASLTGAVAIGFSAGQDIADLADNAFSGGAPTTNQSTYILDNASDSVSLSGPSGIVSSEFQVTMTFTANGASPAPNSVNPGSSAILGALQLTNATRTGTTSFVGSTLTFHLTPDGPGAITATLPAGAAADGVGNPTLASNTLSLTAGTDSEDPVVVVPSNIAVETDPGQATAVVTYANPTATDDVGVVSGPTLTAGLASGAAFPVGETTVTYEAEDAAGNVGSASFTVTVEDKEKPVIQPIAPLTLEADPSGTRRVGISTLVDDNVDTGLQPVFALNGTTIPTTYDFPIGVNNVTINAVDSAGNAADEVIFVLTITPGATPVSPIITTAEINPNRSMTIRGTAEIDSIVRVTFPDNSFVEVNAAGGAFSVTSAADMQGGTVRVTATDDRGYTSAPATVDLFPDYDGPTVTITGPAVVETTDPILVTITFSETVSGFDQSDVSVAGGTIVQFSDANPVYMVQIRPDLTQDLVVSVAAGGAQDSAANPNVASNVLVIYNATLTETEQLIADAALARNRALIRSRPKISRFLLGGQSDFFTGSIDQGTGNLRFATSSDRPFWISVQGNWSNLDGLETSYGNVATGWHYAPSENLLLGVMGIFDKSVSEEISSRVKSRGWLVGPYAVARLPNQPLVFSASYLRGQSENRISPLGTYEDSYGADRVLATFGIAGEIELPRLTIIPLFDLAHASERNEAYVGGNGLPVRSLTVTTTDATVGLNFVVPVDVGTGYLELIGGVGITASSSDNGFEKVESTAAQTEFGFRYEMANGGRIGGSITYDGLGDDGYDAFGARATLGIAF